MCQSRNQFIKNLFDNEYKKLLCAAYHLTGDTEVSKDLVQDTFLLATIHFDKLKSHPQPEAWLMLTLRNLSRNENRHQQAHPILSIDDFTNLPTNERKESLDELLPTQISAEDRNILILRFEQRLDYKTISDLLGISEVACRSRVFRAVSRCKKFLTN